MAPDVVILIPVYNDWEALGLLISNLDQALGSQTGHFRLLIVDDGSNESPPPNLIARHLDRIQTVQVLELSRNLGHQRAIATGLCHVRDHIACNAVVIMDGDGEDDPADVPRLLSMLTEHPRACIFAERLKRSEGLTFRICYSAYRQLHRLLTGIPVRVGNFSVLPISQLRRIVTVSDLWNHYAASVVKARLPVVRVPTNRASRLAGKPQMNLVSLVVHGLSAMSVFSDRIGVRLLISAGLLGGLAGCLLFVLLGVREFTDVTIAPWAISTALILCALVPLLMLLSFVFVFVILAGRESSTVLPIRDYVYFVQEIRTQWPLNPNPTNT